MRLHLPHIPRIFTATIFPSVAAGLLWGGFFFVVGLNVLVMRAQPQALTDKLAGVLMRPFSAATHELLAQTLWSSGARTLAKHELAITADLSPVLGADTTTNEQHEAAIANYWKDTAANHPDYRDAYIQLAAIVYAQGNVPQAKTYLLSAQQLDPNNETLAKLLRFISFLR